MSIAWRSPSLRHGVDRFLQAISPQYAQDTSARFGFDADRHPPYLTWRSVRARPRRFRWCRSLPGEIRYVIEIAMNQLSQRGPVSIAVIDIGHHAVHV